MRYFYVSVGWVAGQGGRYLFFLHGILRNFVGWNGFHSFFLLSPSPPLRLRPKPTTAHRRPITATDHRQALPNDPDIKKNPI